jgi:hypothetical protein
MIGIELGKDDFPFKLCLSWVGNKKEQATEKKRPQCMVFIHHAKTGILWRLFT